MTINFQDGSKGLFDIQGKIFHALNTLNTARGTTVPAQVQDALDEFKNITTHTNELETSYQGVPGALASWEKNNTLASALRGYAEKILIEMVDADVPLPSKTLTNALNELIKQMLANSKTVDFSVPATSVATGGSNIGDAVIVATHVQGDGRKAENALADTIIAEVTSDASTLSPTVTFTGRRLQGDMLAHDWPLGSAVVQSVSGTDASASLIENGDFEDETITNTPDKWLLEVATPGTTVTLVDPEVQTVVISGTPDTGYYYLKVTDLESKVRSTDHLVYNANSTSVQTAIRSIAGFELITVAESGTTPNFTHTITFTGVAGNIAQLTSVERMNGSIAHATTTAGDAGTYKGKTLKIDLTSELTALYAPLGTLTAETVYCVHFRMAEGASAFTTGTFLAEIMDGIGGSVTTDSEGTANSHSITLTDLTSTHSSHSFSFRLNKTTTQPVYLRLRISVTESGKDIFIDEVAVAQATQLGTGGPHVAVFTGATASKNGDTYTLTVTNSRAGSLQEWYHRAFDMASKNLLLPSAASGNVPDSVIG